MTGTTEPERAALGHRRRVAHHGPALARAERIEKAMADLLRGADQCLPLLNRLTPAQEIAEAEASETAAREASEVA